MSIYATADTHFGHKLMATYRGFIDFNVINESELNESEIKEQKFKIDKCATAMDDEMIRLWNETVGPKDTVYHLGDFAFNKRHEYYLSKLNGHIHLIMGNHDESFTNTYLNSLKFASVQSMKYLKHNGNKIHLLHYPMESWKNSYHGSFHFHGHTHGNSKPHGKRVDVGVDCWNLKPVSFDALIDKLKDEPDVNHH